MEVLLGILSKFDLEINKLIGVLLFREYPTTLVYADVKNNPIVREWVDCSDDGKIDRYFYFKTSRHNLKEYIEGNISHNELVEDNFDGFLYFEEQENEKIVKQIIITPRQLPHIYKAEDNYYFKIEESVDTEAIINYFDLKNIEHSDSLFEHVKEIADGRGSETYNLHIFKGPGVGYGAINTDLLGKTLSKFEKFYRDVAQDHYLGKNRGEIKLDKKKREEIEGKSGTEVFLNKAASFSIMIRPKIAQFDLFENITDTEKIAGKVFGLILSSEDPEKIKNEYLSYSDYAINSYKDFLKDVFESELEIKLGWYSPADKKEYRQDINYVKANKIIDNIEHLSLESYDEFNIKGKFRAINCDTGHFTFYSLKNEIYTGYFDKLIKESTQKANFINLYELKINRTIIKEPGKQEAKTYDIISAMYLIEE